VASYVPRKPHKVALLRNIEAVLEEYRAYQPLTVRQIFYRLVAKYGFLKTESAYKNQLCEMMTMARRAQLIPMEAIRDDSVTHLELGGFANKKAYLEAIRNEASSIVLDRTAGQKSRLVVFCEAAGMAPQLARVANDYGVRVTASGGFDSLTSKYDLAKEFAAEDRRIEVLHVGDHDPSGGHMFLTLMEDVGAFASDLGGEEVVFTRLAVTLDQIRQYRLPTAPRKPGDTRAFRGDTCQAEALTPDVMNAILRKAIEERTNMAQLQRVLREEKRVRRELAADIDTLLERDDR
jgi:hypothetical protein